MSDFKHKYTQVLALISQAKKEQLLTDDERKYMAAMISSYNREKSLVKEYN